MLFGEEHILQRKIKAFPNLYADQLKYSLVQNLLNENVSVFFVFISFVYIIKVDKTHEFDDESANETNHASSRVPYLSCLCESQKRWLWLGLYFGHYYLQKRFILLPRRRQFVYLIVGKENKGPPPQEAWQLEHVDTVASDGHRSSGSDRGHKMTRSKVKMEREMTITATSSSFSRHQIFVYLWNNLFIFGSRTALVDILICFFHPSIFCHVYSSFLCVWWW